MILPLKALSHAEVRLPAGHFSVRRFRFDFVDPFCTYTGSFGFRFCSFCAQQFGFSQVPLFPSHFIFPAIRFDSTADSGPRRLKQVPCSGSPAGTCRKAQINSTKMTFITRSSTILRLGLFLWTLSITKNLAQDLSPSGPKSVEPRQLSVTTKQLVPNTGLRIDRDTPLILGMTNPDNFKSPDFTLSLDNQTVRIADQGSVRTFSEITKSRNNTGENLKGNLSEHVTQLRNGGTLLSNVGISLAITTSIKGSDYALLSYRESEKRFMLISGYVEQANAPTTDQELFWSNALREASEEIIVVGKDSLPLQCRAIGFGETKELKAYKSLTYSDKAFTLKTTELPAFLISANAGSVLLGDQATDVGFIYARQWKCGQLIFPLKLEFQDPPEWLFHAEDKLDKSCTPPQLVTLLSRTNMVLVLLAADGRLTDHIYQLQAGNLEKLDLDAKETWLSEAFASDKTSTYPWIVTVDRIRLSDFLAN